MHSGHSVNNKQNNRKNYKHYFASNGEDVEQKILLP